MELVRVLPSAEDEVNVACFHPFAGGGLVYGTKVWFLLGEINVVCFHLHSLSGNLLLVIVGRKA